MSEFRILAIKQVLTETTVQASSQEEAWKKAKNLNESQFIELKNEHSWKLKGVYQDDKIAANQ